MGKQAAANWRRSHSSCAGSGSDAYEAIMPALKNPADDTSRLLKSREHIFSSPRVAAIF